MINRFQSVISFIALLFLAFPSTLCAEENTKEKADIPSGYEEAAEPKNPKREKPKPKKEMSTNPKKEKPGTNLPTGYEDAAKPETRKKKKAKKKNEAPPVTKPVRDKKRIAKEKKKVDGNPQLKALVVQMQQQLKPYFAAELSFANTVCQPDPNQLKKMKALALPALVQTLRSLAIQQGGQMGWGGGFGRNQRKAKDVLQQFEDAASQIVTEVFPPETLAIYREELEYRKEFRAMAGALAMVAHLDSKFRLTVPQREALTDSIQEVWQRSWQRYLQIMVGNPQFFPPVPEDAIVPHLNPVQVKQWKSMQRQDLGFHWQNLHNFQHGLFRNLKQEVDWFEEPKEGALNGGVVRLEIVGGVAVAIVEQADEEEPEE